MFLLLLFFHSALSYEAVIYKPDEQQQHHPLVSLITPTYERRDFLAKSLELIERQDYPNLEVIIVDDSPEPLAVEAQRTPTNKVPVTYIHVTERKSIGAKRNIGLKAAKGEVIVHWDDDDYFRSFRVSDQVAPILAKEVDMTVLEHHFNYVVQERQFYTIQRIRSWGPHFGTLVYRRMLWDLGLRYADNSLAEDYGFVELALELGFKLKILDNNDGKHVYIRHSNTWQYNVEEAQVSAVPRPSFFSEEDEEFYSHVPVAKRGPEERPPNYYSNPNIRWNRPELAPRNAASESVTSATPTYPSYGPPAYDVDKGAWISWVVTVVIVMGTIAGVAWVFFYQWRSNRQTNGLFNAMRMRTFEEVGGSSLKGYGGV